jgi:hypothetical protein
MRYLGNPILGYNMLERRTIAPAPGFYPNAALFRRVGTADQLITTAAQIDNTATGVLLVQPEGVEIVAGDRIDLTCGTIRIDIAAYEAARLDEIELKGSSKMADLSALLVEPLENKSITGHGCVIQLVHVVR